MQNGSSDDLFRRVPLSVMFSPHLSPQQRERLISDLVERAAHAGNDEWREYWNIEVSILRGDTGEVVQCLREVSLSRDPEIVVTALTALGDWHRFSGAHELARQAYEEALQKGTATQTVHVCIKLADLYSDCQRPDLALSALQPLVRTVRELPADVVQFVLVGYLRAHHDAGRLDEAREFADHAIELFPDRSELVLIKEYFSRQLE
jgi:tetratricopeptide (TPR) repeat protein